MRQIPTCTSLTICRESAICCGMDLEAYRQSANLTFEKLKELMNVKSVSQMRRLCLGEELLRDHRLDRAIEISGGQVTAFAVHQRRMAYLRTRPGGVGPMIDSADAPIDAGRKALMY